MSFENRKSSHLGLPLPKGVVRVYQRDAAGRPQFVGEDPIDHTPENERVELLLGNAFDIVAERRQTEFDKISDRILESAYEIVLRNHKEEAVSVELLEPLGGRLDHAGKLSSVPETRGLRGPLRGQGAGPRRRQPDVSSEGAQLAPGAPGPLPEPIAPTGDVVI